jgi:hypothetical protein
MRNLMTRQPGQKRNLGDLKRNKSSNAALYDVEGLNGHLSLKFGGHSGLRCMNIAITSLRFQALSI